MSLAVENQTAPSEAEPELHSCLAHELERVRQELLALMLEKPLAAELFARQLCLDLNRGRDFSDILLLQAGDKERLSRISFHYTGSDCGLYDQDIASSRPGQNVVQDFKLVQPSARNSIDLEGLPGLVSQELAELHFLPLYLLEVSEKMLLDLSGSPVENSGYRLQLRAFQARMKTLRQDMISANTGLVAFVAHKYKTQSLSFDDLMQEGLVGLIKAVDRFDPSRGCRFSTYAVFWIRQAISRLIVKQDKTVALPVALAEKSSPLFEAMRVHFLQHDRWPSTDQLKYCCNLSEQEIKAISSYYQAVYDSGDDSEDGMPLMEKMQQRQFAQPLADLIGSDLVNYIDKALACLPEKQAVILAMRFGLKNQTEMTLQAVADQLQVTRERVRQIQNQALRKLKQQFGLDLRLFLEVHDI